MATTARQDGHPPAPKDVNLARLDEIRTLALAALGGSDPEFPVWSHYGALKQFEDMRFDPGYLEALVAICVVGQIRPRRALRAMGTLRRIRQQRGEDAVFAAFEARVQAHSDTSRLTVHGFSSTTFADVDHAPVWEKVGEHLQTLADLGYQGFLNSGTLLGAIRDQRLIDHDDDVDLAVVLKAGDAVSAAREWSQLRETLQARGALTAQSEAGAGLFRLTHGGGAGFDPFPAWIEADQVYVYPYAFGELPEAALLPLTTCALTGYPVPADPPAVLAQNYGPGWREPDPYFKFPFLAADRRFRSFLEAVT